jgi:hypothetical protein
MKPNTFGIARNAKDLNRAASLLRKYEAGVNVRAPQYAKQLAAVERLYVKMPSHAAGSQEAWNMHQMLTDPNRFTMLLGRRSPFSPGTEAVLRAMVGA